MPIRQLSQGAYHCWLMSHAIVPLNSHCLRGLAVLTYLLGPKGSSALDPSEGVQRRLAAISYLNTVNSTCCDGTPSPLKTSLVYYNSAWTCVQKMWMPFK